jgi:hypothetical protein
VHNPIGIARQSAWKRKTEMRQCKSIFLSSLIAYLTPTQFLIVITKLSGLNGRLSHLLAAVSVFVCFASAHAFAQTCSTPDPKPRATPYTAETHCPFGDIVVQGLRDAPAYDSCNIVPAAWEHVFVRAKDGSLTSYPMRLPF